MTSGQFGAVWILSCASEKVGAKIWELGNGAITVANSSLDVLDVECRKYVCSRVSVGFSEYPPSTKQQSFFQSKLLFYVEDAFIEAFPNILPTC